MSKSHSIPLLFGVLMLCCAPVLAQAGVSVEGAEPVGNGEYVAMEGSIVSLGVHANAGDTLALLAAGMDESGQPDYSVLLLLLLESNSSDGAVSGQFQIPEGLAGRSFQLVGVALAQDGTLTFQTATLTIVASQG